jgi:hypothetical protein
MSATDVAGSRTATAPLSDERYVGTLRGAWGRLGCRFQRVEHGPAYPQDWIRDFARAPGVTTRHRFH